MHSECSASDAALHVRGQAQRGVDVQQPVQLLHAIAGEGPGAAPASARRMMPDGSTPGVSAIPLRAASVARTRCRHRAARQKLIHCAAAQAYRVRHFEAQEAAWRHAARLTEYVSAVRTRVEASPVGQARTEAEAWIDWAAARVERLDPLNTPPRLLTRADDLRPFRALGPLRPLTPHTPGTPPSATERHYREADGAGAADSSAANAPATSTCLRPHS